MRKFQTVNQKSLLRYNAFTLYLTIDSVDLSTRIITCRRRSALKCIPRSGFRSTNTRAVVYILMGAHARISKHICVSALKNVFILANLITCKCRILWQMPHIVAFHLGLHWCKSTRFGVYWRAGKIWRTVTGCHMSLRYQAMVIYCLPYCHVFLMYFVNLLECG